MIDGIKKEVRRRFQRLTCAHSYASVAGGSEVTVEAFVGVTHVPLGAQLAHLLGTRPAAAAAVQHQAHAHGALRGGGGARALVAALLTGNLSTHRHTRVKVTHPGHGDGQRSESIAHIFKAKGHFKCFYSFIYFTYHV